MTLLPINGVGDIDNTDLEVITGLMGGKSARLISQSIKIPLSTVQRRIRLIQERGILKFAPQLDYAKLGLQKGLLHVYLKDGNLQSAAAKLAKIDGVISASVHIGNSDVVVEFVFSNPDEILGLIATVKKVELVERVVWSQQIHVISEPLELKEKNGKAEQGRESTRRKNNGNA